MDFKSLPKIEVSVKFTPTLEPAFVIVIVFASSAQLEVWLLVDNSIKYTNVHVFKDKF
jgi:hypothetical protein